MHTLLHAVTRALERLDAKELERLLDQVSRAAEHPARVDAPKVARSADVLSRQLRAAEVHLGRKANEVWEGKHPWVR